jgi:hypothetical protein
MPVMSILVFSHSHLLIEHWHLMLCQAMWLGLLEYRLDTRPGSIQSLIIVAMTACRRILESMIIESKYFFTPPKYEKSDIPREMQ